MFGVLLLVLFSGNTHAHPTYIRLGYASCTGCHTSAQGGGLLTPYGKGIAMTQAFVSKEPEEDETEHKFLQALQFRVMRQQTKEETRTFPMQFDYLTQYRFNENIRFDGTLAVAPKPKDESPEDSKPAHKRIYARVLGMSWVKPHQRVSIAVGTLPIGLGLVDHTAYVRSENRNQVTDIPIALKHYWESESFITNQYLYIANPSESPDNKENGVGGQWWYRPIRHVSLGLQALAGESKKIRRKLGGVLLKAGYGKWAFLAEADRAWRNLKEDDSEFRQWTWFQQLSFYPIDQLHLYVSWQGFERDRAFLTREQRRAAGIEWRLHGNLTLAYEARKRTSGQAVDDSQLMQLYLNWW